MFFDKWVSRKKQSPQPLLSVGVNLDGVLTLLVQPEKEDSFKCILNGIPIPRGTWLVTLKPLIESAPEEQAGGHGVANLDLIRCTGCGTLANIFDSMGVHGSKNDGMYCSDCYLREAWKSGS